MTLTDFYLKQAGFYLDSDPLGRADGELNVYYVHKKPKGMKGKESGPQIYQAEVDKNKSTSDVRFPGVDRTNS